MNNCSIPNCEKPIYCHELCRHHYYLWLRNRIYASERKCSVTGCTRNHYGRGYCALHHRRWVKHGDPNYVQIIEKPKCKIADCPNKAKVRGWCNKHYLRWLFHGDPIFTKIAERGSGSIVELKNRPGYFTKFIWVDCPFTHRHILIREHIWIAEQQIIHRKLKRGELVHHIDGNSLNNAIDNLKVMTRKEHAKIHDPLMISSTLLGI